MAEKTAFTRLELNNTIRIALLFGFRMLGLFMLFPILSIANLDYPSTPALLGIALGIYGLSQASLQIPFGLLSDKYGRKRMIIIGLLLFIIGSIVAAVAENIYQLIIGRALQGCGAIASVLLAYLADLTQVTVRIRAMAMVGMSIGASFLLSLMLGPVLYQFIGLSGIFYSTALLGCLGIAILLNIKEPVCDNHIKALEYKLTFSAMKEVLGIKSLWSLHFSVLSIHACITMVFLFIPTLFIQQDIALSEHWYVYLLTMIISLVIALPLIIWTEKKQKINVSLFFSLSLLISSYLLFFNHHSLPILILSVVLFFAAFNVLEALLPSSVSRIAPVQYRGMAMGIFSSHQFLGSFIGGTLGGIILHYFSLSILLCLAITFIFIAIGLLLINPINTQKRTQTFVLQKNHAIIHIEQWAKKQQGVLEASYQPNNGALYLKTDLNIFDEQQFNQQISILENHSPN